MNRFPFERTGVMEGVIIGQISIKGKQRDEENA